ncbi:KamA family radical SAM protein [Candidatus Thorarchaeota archaeon]|nr:MAG: KamA family radical SAM protein [Candidatus Thorarchaeota archaeon]
MSWQESLENCITSVDGLDSYLHLDDEEKEVLTKICGKHPVRVSRYYMSLIDGTNRNDPIRKLAIPHPHEQSREGTYDTSGERANTIMPGLQHKYRQTALILATNACATYCRHCFRKRLVGVKTDEIIQDVDKACEYIRSHNEINNVLITGGDPFVLPTDQIESLLKPLTVIPHLDFVRFGTRVPVTFPDRILMGDGLVSMLKRYSTRNKRIYIVTQFNHENEITDKSTRAVEQLQNAGTIVSNQTVLLKGVNDSVKQMTNLMRGLLRIGVLPYYVFQCRPVKRVKAHFQVPLIRGAKIVEDLNKNLDGHGKRFRYIMSHPTGKIEILGVHDGMFVFKYHQAKNPDLIGKIFTREIDAKAAWLGDITAELDTRTASRVLQH